MSTSAGSSGDESFDDVVTVAAFSPLPAGEFGVAARPKRMRRAETI
jgi:hypothetical protein